MLCIAGKNLTQLPNHQNPSSVKHLDVSQNQLQKGIQFKPFVNVMTLIIDQNAFKSLVQFPAMRELQTLSANKNMFSDVQQFVIQCQNKYPKLKNLSTLKNPMNPSQQSTEKYTVYKKTILAKLPSINSLDGQSLIVSQLGNQTQKYDQAKYEKIIGKIEFDQKYAQDAIRSVKTRSQGNRFLRNHHL